MEMEDNLEISLRVGDFGCNSSGSVLKLNIKFKIIIFPCGLVLNLSERSEFGNYLLGPT